MNALFAAASAAVLALAPLCVRADPVLLTGPASDSFAGRTDLGGALIVQHTTSNVGATAEAGEPAHAGNDAEVSVWWQWTAPAAGTVEIETLGSGIDSVLAVYTGSAVNALTLVAQNDDSDGFTTSRVSFTAAAGVSYAIAVDGYEGMAGDVVLSLRTGTEPPVNDDFAAAAVLTGGNPSVAALLSRATAQPGEPAHAGSAATASAWWTWTPPAAAVATLNVQGTGFPARVAVYTGSSPAALAPVTSVSTSPGNIIFAAAPGTTYRIAVDTVNGFTGLLNMQIASGPAYPANDNFAGAAILTEAANGNSLGATAEAGEPAHAGSAAAASVWWHWTAPDNSRVTISSAGTSYMNRLAVYTGSAVNVLTEIGSSTLGSLIIQPVAGTTYFIAIDGAAGATGLVSVSVGTAPPLAPANDNFAARAALGNAASVNLTTSSAHATAESGEPAHTGAPAAASTWWTWTSPGGGSVVISTAGSSFDTRLSVYSGSALNTLTLVAGNDDADAATITSRTAFPVTAGAVYQIAVDGFAGFTGTVALSVEYSPPPPPPANDDLANAAVLTAGSAAAGTTLNATAETGEPAHAGLLAMRSVWWHWTAPGNGMTTVSTIGSPTDTVLGIYTGSAVNALTPVAANDDRDSQTRQSSAVFRASVGTVYFIAVDTRGAAGPIVLNATFVVDRFLNDHFAERFALPSQDLVEFDSDFALATPEPGEPAHGGSPASQSGWWAWTAPRRGYYTLSATGSGPVRTAIYTGSALNSLTTAASGSHTTPATFLAGATPFQIAVDTAGTASLTLSRVPPPAHDDIASAAALSGTVNGDLTQATAAEFEASHGGVTARQSLWFTFSGGAVPEVISLSTQGSAADTVLAVYAGTPGTLALVKENNDTAPGSTWSQVSFRGEPGTVYYAVVDAADGMGGAFSLTLSRQTLDPGSNDWFATATPLTGPRVTAAGSNVYGSRETGEPAHDGAPAASSLWWRWTAPLAGRFSVQTTGSSFSTRIGIYTGSAVNALTRVGSGRARADFTAAAGTSYSFAIDGVAAAEGDIVLNLLPLDLPANDHLAAAADFSGSAAGINVLATAEPEEVTHAGSAAAHSLWWQWTPAQSGFATLTTAGSSFDTVLSVYLGSRALGISSVMAENDDTGGTASSVRFLARRGITYLFALDGKAGATGTFALNLNNEVISPVNDHFANATLLTGKAIRVTGDNLGGTAEPGEDLHAGYPPDSTVWWKWTAVNTGSVTVDTAGTQADTRTAVYTGSSVSQLSLIASNDDADIVTVTSRLTFNAVSGTTYHIVVDTLAATSGPITLSVAESATTMRSYQQWAAGKGFASGQDGAASDPDGDGTPNLAEFTLDSDPLAANSGAWFSLTLDAQKRMVASATVDPGAALVMVTMEFSSQSDTDFVDAGVPVFTRFAANRCGLTWTDTVTVTAASWRHARLRIEGYGQVIYSEIQAASALVIPASANAATRATTFLSSPLVMPRQTRAVIGTVGAGTLTLQRALPAFTGPRYLVLPDGTTAQITGASGTQVQLGSDLSGIATPGMSVDIHPYRTLGSFFGAANEAGLTAGLNAASADTVLSVKPDGLVGTFFFTPLGGGLWVDDRYDPAASVIVPPEAGLIVQRRTGAAVTLYLTGAVRGPLSTPVEQGYNLAGTVATRPVRLDSLGLFTGNPATGLAAGANAGAADNLLVMNPNGSSSLYFRFSFNGQTGWMNSAFDDSAGVLIAPGSAIYIHRKAPRAAFAWTRPAP